MMDDDDEYATDFLAEMVRRLGDAAYAKLSVWRLRHGEDAYVWDTRVIGGPSYAIRGSTVEPTDANDMSPEEATAFRDAWLLGFAWSGVYRRERRAGDPVSRTRDRGCAVGPRAH